MNPADLHRERGTLLYHQRRYADAERELRAALALEPQAHLPHALLGLTLAKLERFPEASAAADQAIGLAPDEAFCHYVQGLILFMRNRYNEAEPAARQAIQLDPYDAQNRWLMAAIQFEQRKWPSALESAEAGLAIDPEHNGCINLRAMALVKLGRKAEAGAAIDGALARDPDNAVSHANRGWTLLHQGEHQRALEHFREALRLDPNLDWARAGIVEALKARHLIYRLMLRYFLWMASLSGRAQWAILLGGYFGYRFLRQIADSNPSVAPFVWPVLIAYIAFAIMSWLADPLFNLMLRLNRFGRLALSPRQTWASNVMGILFLLALAALIAGIAVGGFPWLMLAGVFALLTVPASSCFRLAPGWPTVVMTVGTVVIAAAGFVSVGLWFYLLAHESDRGVISLLEPTQTLSSVFIYGMLISQFGYNYLRSVEPPK
jgi:tetratricopeptide (TPR) repeat protein